MRALPALLPVLLLLAPPALADDGEEDLLGDEEDLLGGDGEDDDEDEDRLDSGDDIDMLDDEEALDAIEPRDELEGDPLDLLEGEPERPVAADSADIYRDYQAEVSGLAPDEEVIAWEEYLADYPNTAFRDRIQRRIDALMAELYGETIETGGEVDADEEEIPFSQGLLIENLNPRTRLQTGFEWGLPDYLNLFLDYEHQVRRDLSFHGGARRRYTGWSFEGGVRYALVKSVRTQTIVSVIGDVHLNGVPAFIGFRPLLAAGKRFGDKLDVQAQLGPDLELRSPSSVRLIGGGNVTFRASENVAVFGETSLNMKNLTWKEGGSFRFNVASFGLKFYPELDAAGTMEVNVGTSIPFASNYWMYHFGSVMGQVNYYF